MMLTRRDYLKAGVMLSIGVSGPETVAAQPDPGPVWVLENGIMRAVRRVTADQCYLPQRTFAASGWSLGSTLRLNEGALIGLVLNSDSARGPRYVVAIQRAKLRVYEIAWPGTNWAEWNAPIVLAKDHSLYLSLTPERSSSRLKIRLDEKQLFECLLPARLEGFYQPGVLVFDGLGSVSSMYVSHRVQGRQVVLPVAPAGTGKRRTMPQKSRSRDAFGNWLEKAVKDVRQKTGVPALACAVADGNAVVAAAADGVRKHGSDTPVSINDQFHLGSITKSMTSSLLAILIEEKRLTWSAPLERLLPDLAQGMQEAYRRMPLAFVVHEATGLLETTAKGLDYGPKGNSLAALRTAWLKEVLSLEPAFTPGTKHEYRNINYVLAGAIVDRLSGRETWEQCIRTKLFVPLGVTTAGYGPMGLPGDVIQPYGHRREEGTPRPIWGDNAPSMSPAATLHMSVTDLARFGQLHLKAELGQATLSSSESIRELHKPLNGYGKGWAVGKPDGKGRYDISHWGTNGLNTAEIIIRPSRGAAIAIMTNESPNGEGHGGQAVSQLAILVLEQGLKLKRSKA